MNSLRVRLLAWMKSVRLPTLRPPPRAHLVRADRWLRMTTWLILANAFHLLVLMGVARLPSVQQAVDSLLTLAEHGRAFWRAQLLVPTLAAIFGEPFIIEGRETPLAVRSGLALYPEHGKDADTLVQNAEAALRNARSSGEKQLRYSAEKHGQAVARLALEHKLRVALDRKQFELHYQPKVSVKTRHIEGVEALLRWRDPDLGLISPGSFLPLLESTGLIVDVGDWILRQAAEDCQHWQRLGLPPIRIAVNISPIQLRRADFVLGFLKATQSWSNSHAGLDLEITEGVLQEDSEAEVKKLNVLRANGTKIAVDDFGTGYSSLSRISSLPIDTLKIDRSFVGRLPDEKTGRTLVSTIISLARAFEMTVVAEGVETTEQLGVLWEMGCDQSQGYLHSIPVTRDEFADLLQHGKGRLMLPAIPPDERK